MKEILSIFFNPISTAIIIIVCFFIFITRDECKKLVGKIILSFKNKSLSVDVKNEQAPIEESEELKDVKKMLTDLGESKEQIKKLKKNNKDLFELWKFYMFSYFNFYLVNSTKLALIWLKNNPNRTKEMFKLNINVAQNVANVDNEKETIFNVLVSNYLISKDSRDLYSITNIGNDFLKFIKLA